MKLGISYNVFDGEELLEGSIRSIRNQVDYVSVVYQDISNYGRKAAPSQLEVLNHLVKMGYINELYKFNPLDDYKDYGEVNLVMKRSIGLDLARENGCTHYMSMDSDEFYVENQFAYMKKVVEEEGWDAAACKHCQYWKDSIYRFTIKEEEYVSTIYEIKDSTRWTYYIDCPYPIDPMRKANNRNYKAFGRGEVEMHHMSFVRKNLYTKLINHSCHHGFVDIDSLVKYYDNWVFGMPAMFVDGRLVQLDKIERLFDVYSEETHE